MPISNSQTQPDDSIADRHLSADTVAAFVAHNLLANEEEDIFTHLSKCKNCREWVFVSIHAQGVQKKSAYPFLMQSWRAPASVWLNATGIAALLLLLLLPLWRSEQTQPRPKQLESRVPALESAPTRARRSEQHVQNIPTGARMNLGRQKFTRAGRRSVRTPDALISSLRIQQHNIGGDSAITSLLLKGTVVKPELPKEGLWNKELGDSRKPRQSRSWQADAIEERWDRLSLNTPPLGNVGHAVRRTLGTPAAWTHAKLIASVMFNESGYGGTQAAGISDVSIERAQFVKHVVLTKAFQ